MKPIGKSAAGAGVFGIAKRAFTLLELLVVMAIMSLLIALAPPAVMNALGATSLTTAGDLVRNKLTQAQQEAIAKNAPIEVRFYYYEDRDYEGGERVRAFQMFQLTNNPEEPIIRVSEPIYLEGGIVLSSDITLSSFPDFGSGPGDVEGYCTRATTVGSAKYWAFRFLPDGSTNLPGNALWFVTALEEVDEERIQSGGENPPNYFTIQIDPLTGAVRTFRPGE